jgi:hypothetical protein
MRDLRIVLSRPLIDREKPLLGVEGGVAVIVVREVVGVRLIAYDEDSAISRNHPLNIRKLTLRKNLRPPDGIHFVDIPDHAAVPIEHWRRSGS